MTISARYSPIGDEQFNNFNSSNLEMDHKHSNQGPALRMGLRTRRIPVSIFGIIGLFGLLFFLVDSSSSSRGELRLRDWKGKGFKMDEIPVGFESYEVPEGEWSCNPFQQAGRLIVDILKPVSC